ncbi:unnamed protein product [Sphagnum jensenii]|uniref:Uncharacterized protein n=1 Tax=Sphagnum jensenii TaxID=128206 RepID=A0ABP1AJC9_9BRYO
MERLWLHMPRSFQVLYKNGSGYIHDDLHSWDKAGGGGGGGGEGVRGSGSDVINQEYLDCTIIYSGISKTVLFCGSGWGWREDGVVGLAAIQEEEERFQALVSSELILGSGISTNFLLSAGLEAQESCTLGMRMLQECQTGKASTTTVVQFHRVVTANSKE